MHHKLQCLASHLRPVLGLDTLAVHQLGSQKLLTTRQGPLWVSSSSNAPYCANSCVCPGYGEPRHQEAAPGNGALGSHMTGREKSALVLMMPASSA